MAFLFTCLRRVGPVGLAGLVLLLAPLRGQGQTTIANYDFNSATAYPVAPAATAAGISSVATSSQGFSTATGTATGAGAYAATTTAGPALNMTSSSGVDKYFEFSLGGISLPNYSAFKLYLQSYRSLTGATTLTLKYSVNGGPFLTPGSTCGPGLSAFAEGSFDLTGLTALNAPTSLVFRLVASGATGSGPLRLDNFQVQATNTVAPVISTLAPATAEAGSAAFALTVGGSNFRSGAVITFNGLDLPTTYNSPTSLTATVPASAVVTGGSYPVTVTDPAAGGSAATSFSVTPALPHWTGRARTSSWFDAANWSVGRVPGADDEVLLDHRDVAGSYTISLDQNVAVSLKSLTISPGAGDSIFVVVPVINTLDPALTLTNAGAGATALTINDKGVVTNASGASTGSGIEIIGSGPTAFIYNGGSYRHASSRSHSVVVDNLSAAPGTELGVFDFRLPANGPNSYTISASGRTYGTLIFRGRPGVAASSYAGAGGSLTVQGNLIIGPGVKFTTTLSGDLRLAGDLRSQGTLQVKPSTNPISLVSQLLLAGTKPQTISGTVVLDPTVGLALNNPASAVLATPVVLDGPLTLTSGALTTSTTNLLTLNAAVTLTGAGGSSTSFIDGPLARLTAAGPVSNLTFPTGRGAFYRPVVLNATAQDATMYLVTQKEGPAPDFNRLLAGTPARPTLTRVSQIRAYTITPTPAANNFSGTVTLSFEPDDRVDAPADAGLVVGKNSGTGWENIGSSSFSVLTPVPASGYISGTLTSGTFTSFSDFALARTNAASSPNPLPVTLVSFVARRQAGAVQLSWATASELNSHQFAVQRSLDSRRFATIATVAGHGTTTQAQTYAALDPAAPPQALCYRLAQFDTDGTVAFSPVVTLAAASGSPTPSLYPNPAHDRLTLFAPAGTTVQVLDLTGRVLQTSSLPPSGEVMLSGLPAGLYLLRSADGQRWRFNKE